MYITAFQLCYVVAVAIGIGIMIGLGWSMSVVVNRMEPYREHDEECDE